MLKTSNNLSEPVLFFLELHPNRSSSKRDIKRLNYGLCATLIPAGIAFISLGAWPVCGFLFLEIFALIMLLNFNHRCSYVTERILITEACLKVERIDQWGRKNQWSFQRHWLQVNIDQNEDLNFKLELRSHGKSLVIGSFLSPRARRNIAISLNQALNRLSNCPENT